jgi:hypothetical protein
MNKRRLLIRASTFIAGVVAFYFALLAGARSPGPRGPSLADHPAMMASRSLLAEIGPAAQAVSAALAGPRAKVESTEFNFGIVDPFRQHRHVFEVQNAGDSPLLLLNQGTSNNRLVIDIDPHTVSPGRTAKITVLWDALAADDDFSAQATVQTNDPANPTIVFALRGEARILLAAEPPVLSAPRIKAGEPTTLTTTIVSPEWDAFTLEADPSLSGVDCAVHPMEPAELQQLNVNSGWRLVVTLPAELPPGPLRERIHLTARRGAATTDSAAARGDVIHRELPLVGNVLGGLTVYGKDLNEMGNIAVGTLDAQKGYETTLTIKVNDAEPKLYLTGISAEPAYIEAQLEPSAENRSGSYDLHVRIPPTDRAAGYLGQNRGKLTISFDHPRIEQLNLGVEFVVLTSRK